MMILLPLFFWCVAFLVAAGGDVVAVAVVIAVTPFSTFLTLMMLTLDKSLTLRY